MVKNFAVLELTSQENLKYNRHLILNEVGLNGQLKIKKSSVLVVGAGGLGTPVLQYLTAAGVGEIGIIDNDVVDASNLQRQVLFTENDLGKNKAKVIAQRLAQLNSNVTFNVYEERLSSKNGRAILNEYEIIVDGTDNYSTRYLINDLCLKMNKPIVYGSIYKFEGQVSVFNYNNGPSYRCLFPEPPKPNQIKNCSEIGVLGILPGIIGTQQANEVLKIILGIGDVLSGILLTYNALKSEFNRFEILPNNDVKTNVKSDEFDITSFDYDLFCGIDSENEIKEIDQVAFKKCLNNNDYQIIDLRGEWETPELKMDNVLQMDTANLIENPGVIDQSKKCILVCQNGLRSLSAINYLIDKHKLINLYNLKGGLNNY